MALTYSQTAYSSLSISNNEATISYSGLDYNADIGDTIEVYNDTTKLDLTTNYTLDTTNKNVVLKTNTFTGGTTISIYRIANKTARTIDFANASVLTEADLDNSALQTFHVAQEALDTAEQSITADADGTFDANTKRIKNVVDPQNPQDAATKAYVDGGSDVQTVAGLNSEIALLGTSAMATATTGHIPVLANVVEQTVNYTVTVASSKFNIQGGEYGSATETPALTLIRGYTYVFDVSDNSVATHPLVFMNGSSTLGTSDGVTTAGTAGQAGAKVTVVVSDSVTITKYSCSAHGDTYGNTITLRHDDIKEVADISSNVSSVAGVSSSIPTVAGLTSELSTVSNSTYKGQIETVAGSAYKDAIETVAESTYKGLVETVGESGYKAKVEAVGATSAINAINTINTNINAVTDFGDTYHQAGSSAPTTSNVSTGDLWFDTGSNTMKVYNGSSWVSASSSISTVSSVSEFSASDGQGTDNKYFAKNHDQDLEIVWLNGVRLKQGHDYISTATNTATTAVGSTAQANFIRLETVPSSTDTLSVMAFGQISNTNVVSPSGGTFSGAVTFEGQNTHNTGSNTFTMPTTRGTDGYVLTRDDTAGTGGTAWKETVIAPTISSITYPTESGTVPTALQASGGSDNNVKTLTITNGGTGYSGSGTLSATGGGGNGFAGTYTVSGGVINSVTITDAGQEYTSAPTIVVSGSTSGTSAVITASILETLLINGSNFTSTVTVNISGNSVSSSAFAGTVSVNGAGTVVTCSNVTKQASADNYTLTVTNTTGLHSTTTVNFSADPSFSTASGSLGTVFAGVATSKTITAGSSVSWYEGSPTMPTWMTHFADGATGTSQNLTGTPDNGSATSEVQNFNIIIRDSENQSHNRDFSLTVVDEPTSTGSTINTYTGYKTHVFTTVGTNSGSITLPAATVLDILVVAGGGSGGDYYYSGGGGAGGFCYFHQYTVSAGTYNITVGDGGTAPTSNNDALGDNGDNSSFQGLTAAVGGGGGSNGSYNGANGGSGGGVGPNGTPQSGGSGTTTTVSGRSADQGKSGGVASGTTNEHSAGAGGGAKTAGGAGQGSGTSGYGGYGGDGYTEGDTVPNFTYIDTGNGSATVTFPALFQTGTGSNKSYAGGGGGGYGHNPYGSGQSDNGGMGGAGGGGRGAIGDANNANNELRSSTAGTDGTGGGGGGACHAAYTGTQGSDGGSGIVIVRYAI